MAACLYRNPGILDGFEGFHVNFCRGNQRFTERGSQLFIICIQAFRCKLLFEYLTHQRETVTVYSGGGHTNQDIACHQFLTGYQILLIYRSHCKTGQIIFVFRIETRHLGRLSSH